MRDSPHWEGAGFACCSRFSFLHNAGVSRSSALHGSSEEENAGRESREECERIMGKNCDEFLAGKGLGNRTAFESLRSSCGIGAGVTEVLRCNWRLAKHWRSDGFGVQI